MAKGHMHVPKEVTWESGQCRAQASSKWTNPRCETLAYWTCNYQQVWSLLNLNLVITVVVLSIMYSTNIVLQSRVWLFAIPWTVACQAPLSVGFSQQEYWSGLPCPTLGDLLDPGIKPTSLTSPALEDRFLTNSTTWEAYYMPGT